MTFIGAGVQGRLFAAAEHCFGPEGEVLVRTVALQTLNTPVDHLTYAQIPTLLAEIDRTVRAQVGHNVACALAASLHQLQADIDAGLGGRLIGALTKCVGTVAEPLLRATCMHLGFHIETVDRSQLPELAEAMRETTLALLGAQMADALRLAVLDAGRARPAGLTTQMLAVARQHLGGHAEAVLQRLCREHLEIAVEEIDASSVRALAMAVEQSGPAVIGACLAAEFGPLAAQALVSPAEPLRRRVVEVTREAVGPFAPQFLEEVCAKHGLPFTAVDDEHLTWLAEVLCTETEPLAGREAADDLARQLRTFVAAKR